MTTVWTLGTSKLGVDSILGISSLVPLLSIVGSIYDASTGLARTSGALYIKPKVALGYGVVVVAPITTVVVVPPSGVLSFKLVPHDYVVEYDPDPSDDLTPLRAKNGYFEDHWSLRSVVIAQRPQIWLHELF